MKKWTFLLIMLGAMPLSMVAQDDDMYFVPSKENIAKEKASRGLPADTYYSGSNRSVDEYNCRGSSYEVLPADTGDIISFSAVEGVYPDSTADFALTRQMSRWDGYEPSDAYWQGYNQGRHDYWGGGLWGWHSPWYYNSYYSWYDPWYYDPWYGYYGGYWGGWYDPWYYGYYGYGWPYYSNYWWHYPYGGYYGWGGYYGGYYGGGYAYHNYRPGTQNHGRITGSGPSGFASGRSHSYSSGTFGGRNVGSFGGSRSSASRGVGTRTSTVRRSATYSNSNGNFGGNASSSGSTYTPSRSSYGGGSSVGSGGGGGSFGGSRSSGGGGGSRSGGGGFGSGRR